MLDLPNVTLVATETRRHELARRTLLDAVSKINFGGVVISTNDPARIPIPGARYLDIPDWPTKNDCEKWHSWDGPKAATTSHVLLMEWDSGIWDTSVWRDEFLDYDFIGAPWPHEKLQVGNGGFSLRSKRLSDFIADNRDRFPETFTDVGLCRTHRPELEAVGGFKWAPSALAYAFSHEIECPGLHYTGGHFGFHSTHENSNWFRALPREEYAARLKLLIAGFGRTNLGRVKAELRFTPPDLLRELGL